MYKLKCLLSYDSLGRGGGGRLSFFRRGPTGYIWQKILEIHPLAFTCILRINHDFLVYVFRGYDLSLACDDDIPNFLLLSRRIHPFLGWCGWQLTADVSESLYVHLICRLYRSILLVAIFITLELLVERKKKKKKKKNNGDVQKDSENSHPWRFWVRTNFVSFDRFRFRVNSSSHTRPYISISFVWSIEWVKRL